MDYCLTDDDRALLIGLINLWTVPFVNLLSSLYQSTKSLDHVETRKYMTVSHSHSSVHQISIKERTTMVQIVNIIDRAAQQICLNDFS
jgi:hypothetical protein